MDEYYAIFDKVTKKLRGTSAQEFNPVPEDCSQTKISGRDHVDFVTLKKRMSRYFVGVDTLGRSYLWCKEEVSIPNTKIIKKNTIQDLDCSMRLFDFLGFEYRVHNRTITVVYKPGNKDVDTFLLSLIEKSLVTDYRLVITEYGNPNKLYDTVDIDIKKLVTDQTITYTLDNPYRFISLWATY